LGPRSIAILARTVVVPAAVQLDGEFALGQ
jgi:hypothetical protein